MILFIEMGDEFELESAHNSDNNGNRYSWIDPA
jgi:hypothetical protein